MARRGRFVLLTVGLMVLLGASGCQLPISREYRTQASPDLTIQMVQGAPETYRGEIVIWGGKILETVNYADRTEITVLAFPLDSGQEPQTGAYSGGRFVARTKQFLDPEVFTRDKTVTLAGEIAGTEKRPLGETQYDYPVLEIKQIYLWPKEEYYGGSYYYPGYYYGPYGWPYYPWDPWFGPGLGRRRYR